MRLTILLIALSLVAACGKASNSNSSRTTGNQNAEIKKGVAPVADSEVAVIEMETPAYGTIKMELYSNIAPKAVARFKELAKEGYYDGIAFHRINKTVIQAGDANTKANAPSSGAIQMKEGDSGKPNVPAEFSDVPYDTGILGAARLGNDVNSANSQFFIMLKREPQFDQKYTVFGKVIEGMNNVMTISGVEPKDNERPIEPVRIKTIRIEPR
ncbi:MAG TPA: peptidylprolyl isomerase [Pyrinomonadaceae bacterium]|nr:peptidylprolyl isomerase [Pyrinomonadaceae bacterium]